MSQDLKIYGKRVCLIGAHPDDIEIGAGALISKIVEQCEVLCVTLSDNQKNPALTNVLEEHRESMRILGVKPEHDIVDTFETRKFPQFRQEILERMVRIQREFRPELVFVHSRADVHQDHNTVTEEALRAFRGVTVLGFDVIRSSYGFFPHFLIGVREADVERKIAALAAYHTYDDKYYFRPELTRAIAIRHGAVAERPFAEGFDILRVIADFDSMEC
jgi:LmbE family N-acetylglucosaminyl deacetylase